MSVVSVKHLFKKLNKPQQTAVLKVSFGLEFINPINLLDEFMVLAPSC